MGGENAWFCDIIFSLDDAGGDHLIVLTMMVTMMAISKTAFPRTCGCIPISDMCGFNTAGGSMGFTIF